MRTRPNLELIVKFIADECSPEELSEVRSWINEAPQNAKYVRQLQKTWNITGELYLNQDEDRAWKKLSDNLFDNRHTATIHRLNQDFKQNSTAALTENKTEHTYSPYLTPSYKTAVAILLIIGLSFLSYHLFWNNKSSQRAEVQPNTFKEVITQDGQHVNLTLSDGTQVFLNGNSVLRFPQKFDGKLREVELKGEAYFSVVHKDSVPFVVHTRIAEIKDIGTKFDVSAYPNDEKERVIVESGMVAVRAVKKSSGRKQGLDSLYQQSDEVILTARQLTEITDKGVTKPAKNVDADLYLDWVEGQLIFDHTPLKEVLRKLNHYYGPQFTVKDSSLYRRKLTASFEHEAFSKVLDVISLSMDMKYKHDPKSNKIIISAERNRQ